MKRIQCFIDGFNLYHAVDKLKRPHLKWFNIASLMRSFIDPNIHEIKNIYYFSAYADWLPEAKLRHEQFVAANRHFGVEPIMSQFKEKSRVCRKCKSSWTAHEEKETDVKIAVALVRSAYRDEFDEAFLVSRDSDLTPPIAMIKHDFPGKTVKIISPPNSGHSKEMGKLVGGKKLASIKERHLERCLLPEAIEEKGTFVAIRPKPYDPPPP